MSVEKTRAYVLKTLPYRESSGIFYLLTERQGVLHGIAKGVRKKKTGASFLERGFLIETLVYSKPHRELHTLADIHMLEYFPRIRNDLVKGAVRDVAFEAVLSSVSIGFPSPDLFSLIAKFLESLEERTGNFPSLLINFYAAFSRFMGFGMESERCIICRKELSGEGDIFLLVEKGGCACQKCAGHRDKQTLIPAKAYKFLVAPTTSAFPEYKLELSAMEERRITRLLASYCQYHCDARSEMKALAFLDTFLFGDPPL